MQVFTLEKPVIIGLQIISIIRKSRTGHFIMNCELSPLSFESDISISLGLLPALHRKRASKYNEISRVSSVKITYLLVMYSYFRSSLSKM